MTQFDQLLRRALMDANLAQYETVLWQTEGAEPDFSPRYFQERMSLLADPWSWEKRQSRPKPRRRIPRSVAVAIAILLLVTAAAAVTISLRDAFFGGLDQRQQEIVENMEIGGEAAKETAVESLLPSPVEHGGVTITPLSILGAKNQLYMVLEIRAPEGTVFSPEDRYHLWGSLSRPENELQHEMLGHSGSFTVVEAGTKEPNVLLGIVEETASYDMGGCSYRIRSLDQYAADGECKTVFGGWDPEKGPTDSWDILIPEDLNQDRVLELPVEGLSMTDGQKTMTLLSMNVSPLGIWWRYHLDGDDPWPRVRIALRMRDGSEVEAALGQLTMGDMGSGLTGTVSFAKPVDLSQAETLLWGEVEIPLEPSEPAPE
ncbi:MAG: hypothetical protein K2L38_01365 [Dysosmobacter sp.]|nr:hypothetical protein [Dysosmobacter sp.]